MNTVCPYCHPSRSTPSYQSPDSVNGAAYIENEVRRVDQLIAQLLDERAALQTRLNHIRSQTAVLPPETLSLIFRHVSSFHDPQNNQSYQQKGGTRTQTRVAPHPLLTIGAVSSRWRRIAYSDPSLWVSITFTVRLRDTLEIAKLLGLFLENSVNLPISLSLDFIRARGEVNDDDLVHPAVDDIILRSLPRIQNLHLINPPKKWQNSVSDRLFQLVNLSLEHFDRPNEDLFLSNSSLLRRLSINCTFMRHTPRMVFHLPWDTLTSLDLTCLPARFCVDLLVRCSNLVEFICRSPLLIGPNQEFQFPESIVSQRLESFHLGYCDPHLNIWLLQSIRLPSLRTLGGIGFCKPSKTENEIIENFLPVFPSTLLSFKLYDDINLEDAGAILKHPNIRHLILHNVSHMALLDTLRTLDSHDQHEDRHLSGLNRLTIQMRPGDVIMSNITELIVDMILKRMGEPDSHGQFWMEIVSEIVDWEDEAKECLKGLVSDGCELEIIENAQPVEWLSQRC